MIIWTSHALDRAKQRGGTWERMKNQIEEKIWSRDWEERYEYDPRLHLGVTRGTTLNLIVETGYRSGVALVRLIDGQYTVVSILSDEQRKMNEMRMWSRTREGAILVHEEHKARMADLGLRPPTLKHSPFSKIRGSK